MSDIYKLQYNGMTLAYPGWNGYVSFEDVPKFKTLTLYASEGGTVTASVLTGMPGDTAQITTAYNTYYRFSGYDTAGGGSLNGNVYTFGDTDADISALYKVNYFTATGGFDKGSNVTLAGKLNVGSTGHYSTGYIDKKALHSAHTGDVSTSYWSASNIWHPSNFSAYSFTANTRMQFNATGYTNGTSNTDYVRLTAASTIGTTVNNTAYYSIRVKTTTWNYSKSFTTTTQNVYGVSAKMCPKDSNNSKTNLRGTIQYVAAGTTGTWTATGIAP